MFCKREILQVIIAMLVRKKDRGLCFYIDFCKLNVMTKKDSYPLPHIQEAIQSLFGLGISLDWTRKWVLADCHG